MFQKRHFVEDDGPLEMAVVDETLKRKPFDKYVFFMQKVFHLLFNYFSYENLIFLPHQFNLIIFHFCLFMGLFNNLISFELINGVLFALFDRLFHKQN